MKNIFLIVILNVVIVITAMGQLNPIKNFYFNHTYDMPNNCFYLSWSKPDTSLTDTLVGYNIYHDDSLFTFTTELYHSCNPCIGAPIVPFCNFINYNMGMFYVHVTAVYNSNSLESTYNDSADFGGYWIGISEIQSPVLTISNVVQKSSLLKIELNKNVENGELIITNILGQTIKIIQLNDQNIITISTFNYTTGLYFLKLLTNENNLTKKILIE
jgi:hypothetical protein